MRDYGCQGRVARETSILACLGGEGAKGSISDCVGGGMSVNKVTYMYLGVRESVRGL